MLNMKHTHWLTDTHAPTHAHRNLHTHSHTDLYTHTHNWALCKPVQQTDSVTQMPHKGNSSSKGLLRSRAVLMATIMGGGVPNIACFQVYIPFPKPLSLRGRLPWEQSLAHEEWNGHLQIKGIKYKWLSMQQPRESNSGVLYGFVAFSCPRTCLARHFRFAVVFNRAECDVSRCVQVPSGAAYIILIINQKAIHC